jgi:signal transduction histidine kinase
MAAGIAHEINNPLAVISGRAQLIKKVMAQRGIVDPELSEQAESISQTSHRISKIISSMKALSRQNIADQFAEFTFEAAWGDVIGISQERLRLRGIRLEVDIEEGVQLWGNSGQISQVFLNLLNNSIDAIESLEDKWIRIEGRKDGRNFMVRVTDSGSGIPLKVQSRLMQPFCTTKEVGKGTGLGLSLAKSILDQHGGSFELNRNSKNTQFVISLPSRT